MILGSESGGRVVEVRMSGTNAMNGEQNILRSVGEVRAELLFGAAKVTAEVWDACAGTDDPFLSHAWFLALEENGVASGRSGWLPLHLVVRDQVHGPLEPGRIAGIIPLYLKNHSRGDFVQDEGWVESFRRAGHAYYPKLQITVPFIPVEGSRILVRPDADSRVRSTLIRSLEVIARQQKVSSVHATLLPEEEAVALEQEGWLSRPGLDYHWYNDGYDTFDDFLAALTPPHRKAVLREREAVRSSGAQVVRLTGGEIKPAHWDCLHRLRAEMMAGTPGASDLGPGVLARLGAVLGDRALLALAGEEGNWRAAALHVLGDEAVFGCFWGAAAADQALLAEVNYYSPMEEAIARGLSRVEAGPRGEQKFARGYDPVVVWTAHWIRKCGFRDTLAEHFQREREQMAALLEQLQDRTPYLGNDGETV